MKGGLGLNAGKPLMQPIVEWVKCHILELVPELQFALMHPSALLAGADEEVAAPAPTAAPAKSKAVQQTPAAARHTPAAVAKAHRVEAQVATTSSSVAPAPKQTPVVAAAASSPPHGKSGVAHAQVQVQPQAVAEPKALTAKQLDVVRNPVLLTSAVSSESVTTEQRALMLP